ncbi:hypothetical protein [Rhodococcus jostii]|uniref:SCO6045-like C-terminal domain-containing protein n=1 Tax=Rhodococcus jostii TaxID=132919 RepID=A0A1H5ECL1_RHOJO|nr:hypothetical protein [Rhodococcus jostii]SED88943.1 hypothetical protein SAMN04490220_5926 [Rhodococcus jostii]
MTGLADRQAALVRALVAAGESPGGFDRDALDTVSTALLRKRSGEVGNHVPHVREACGDRFFALFSAWAAGRPKVSTHADADAFTAHLRSIGELPQPKRRRLLSRRRT